MRTVFGLFVLLHALIHLIGPAAAFGVGGLPLTQPISRSMALLWLLAAVLLSAAGVLLFLAPRTWWAVGVAGLAVSQVVIIASWSDARWGTLANAVLLLGVAYGFMTQGPWSFRTAYARAVAERITEQAEPPLLVEADITHLPHLVQRYLHRAGTIGRPRVRDFRAVFRGRIRGGPSEAWMPFTGEQHNFAASPARFFLMDATRAGIPVQAFHVYADASATMRVRLAGALRVAEAHGPEMLRAETVTLLNDMCVIAPAMLVDAPIQWEELGPRSLRATYTNAGHTVRAVLQFSEAGDLVDFRSEDRGRASADGGSMIAVPWSTPLEGHRLVGVNRIGARGEGRWHDPGGTWTYIEFELTAIEHNVRR